VYRFVRRFVFLSVIGALAGAVPASAQEFSLGYQYQHLSGSGESLNSPVGINVDVAVPIGVPNLGVVGQFDWSRKSESETVFGTSVDATLNLSIFGGGIRWTGTNVPSAEPYVQVLFGASHSSFDSSVAGTQFDNSSSTDPMLQFGGGVAVPVGGIWKVLGQVDYRRIFTEDEGTNSVRAVAGVRVSF
jgi:hypothetical protein